MIVAFILSLTAVWKDKILLKKFVFSFIVVISCLVGLYTISFNYSNYLENIDLEKGRQFAKGLDDREAKDKQDFDNAIATGFKFTVSFNGKILQDANLYYKQTKVMQTNNIYIPSPEGVVQPVNGYVSSGGRMLPGEYMLAPVINKVDGQTFICPNYKMEGLIFRGPYSLVEGKTTIVNIDINNTEYEALLKIQSEQSKNSVGCFQETL